MTMVGSLARLLAGTGAAFGAAQQQVDDLLVSLFVGWRPRFPRELGWRFTPPASIAVFNVIDSPAAVDTLRRVGFAEITLHDHPTTAFANCRCRPTRSPT